MFHVELAPLGGILGPLKSEFGVFWPFWAMFLFTYRAKRALILTPEGLKYSPEVRVEHETCSTICGTPVQAISDHLSWPSWQGGSGKVKICPGMAWIWLWSRPEAPKWVNDPWNGSQMVPPTAPDWFKSISWPFGTLQPLYIKKISVFLYCENYRFLKF